RSARRTRSAPLSCRPPCTARGPSRWRSLRSRGTEAPQATSSLIAALLSPDDARLGASRWRSLRSRGTEAPQATSSLVAALLSPDDARLGASVGRGRLQPHQEPGAAVRFGPLVPDPPAVDLGQVPGDEQA